MNNQRLIAPKVSSGAASQNIFFLLIAWISGLVVWFNPQVGVWFVGFTLVLWLYLGVSGKLGIASNPVNIPIAIFLITALVGVWAAYDQQAAFHKFLIIIGSVLIFYALSGLGSEEIFMAFGLISLTAMLLAVYFLLSHNWKMQPADIGWINQLGSLWMGVRPELPTIFDSPNIPAGILAVMFPIVLSYTWKAQKNLDITLKIIAWSSLVTVIIAIVMSSSRAVWGILIVGFISWIWWEVCQRGIISYKANPNKTFLLGMLLIGGALLIILVGLVTQMGAPVGILPGQSSATTRLNLYHQTTDLIADFWLTGGGLRSFAGLYSEYILDIPYLFYAYAHNLILDITLEQGIFGVISFFVIYAVSIRILINRLFQFDLFNETNKAVLMSLLISMMVIWGHGLVDDSLYGVQGAPFLFVIPGLMISFDKQLALAHGLGSSSTNFSSLSKSQIAIGLSLIGILVMSVFILPPVRSAVMANLGAIQMAKMELAGFPLGSWEDGLSGSDFSDEKDILLNAIAGDPDQRTANHCLGRIALQDGEYQEAAQFLLTAHEKDPNHNGIRKQLGYTYVWLGDYDQAYALIRTIPEAEIEMANYATWWLHRGNQNLANHAALMFEYFKHQH